MNVSSLASAAFAVQSYATSRPTLLPKLDSKAGSDTDPTGSAPEPASANNAVGKTVNLTA